MKYAGRSGWEIRGRQTLRLSHRQKLERRGFGSVKCIICPSKRSSLKFVISCNSEWKKGQWRDRMWWWVGWPVHPGCFPPGMRGHERKHNPLKSSNKSNKSGFVFVQSLTRLLNPWQGVWRETMQCAFKAVLCHVHTWGYIQNKAVEMRVKHGRIRFLLTKGHLFFSQGSQLLLVQHQKNVGKKIFLLLIWQKCKRSFVQIRHLSFHFDAVNDARRGRTWDETRRFRTKADTLLCVNHKRWATEWSQHSKKSLLLPWTQTSTTSQRPLCFPCGLVFFTGMKQALIAAMVSKHNLGEALLLRRWRLDELGLTGTTRLFHSEEETRSVFFWF